ncbi:MAG TPA: hypothetical protein VM734_04340 [Kofleriaceae bacterium]|nr:hypothetical protein [Kofleriaceae bacterium]
MRAAALAAALGLAACASSATSRTTGADADDAVIRIRTDVPEAALWFDGRFIGPVGGLRGGIAVEPGKHRLELRHDEYHSHYQELELAPRQRVTLDVELAPVLP